MSERRGLGWIPDVPKPNDYTAEHPQVASVLKRSKSAAHLTGLGGPHAERAAAPAAPPAVDLRQWFSPVENQGQLGSCTANAAVALLEYFERRAAGRHVDASRLFVYKAERDLLGLKGDTGAYLRTAMQTLVTFGAPPEKYWPYDGRPPETNTRFDVEPSAFCYAFGQSYKAIKYFRLDPDATPATQVLANIKAFAAAGFPSMFGFPVYDEYEHPLPGALIAFPKQGSHYYGGHANVVAGYDDNKMIGTDKGALLVRNSWDTTWGDQGYGWLSYRYVTAGYAVDWWSMVSADWIEQF